MTTAEWALVIASVSLGFSVWSGIVARRATQFKRLSELRSKVGHLRWQMYYRLSDVKEAARNAGLLDDGAEGHWKETIAALERLLQGAGKTEESFGTIYNVMAFVPFVLPESTVEAWHHELDQLRASVEISRTELIPKFKESAEKMAQLLEVQRRLTKELERAENDVAKGKDA